MSDEIVSATAIPSFVVHYSRGEPFRSITSAQREHIPGIIGKLKDTNAWGLARFSNQNYLAQRFEGEERLRQQFIDIGGKPKLRNPIYFFLGRHPQFESHEMNIGYLIDLKDIDPWSISFTYGDSMFCFIEENRKQAGTQYSNPLCAEVYSLQTLSQLLSHPCFPKADPLHVEAQLWTEPNFGIVRKVVR